MANRLRKPRLGRSRARLAADGSTAPAANSEPRIEEISAHGLRWVNINQPTSIEQAWMQEHFDFHELDYQDVSSRNQRPKLDEYPSYQFLVLHLPVFDKTVGRVNAAELDIFVGIDYIITLPNQPIKPIEYLFDRYETREHDREQLFSKGSGLLLYTILDHLFTHCFPMLAKIGTKLERLEQEIFDGKSNEVVRDILNVKQEIINFRKIIRPERTVLKDLELSKGRYITGELELYFDDIVDTAERIWDMLENYKETVESLEATNESVLSHRVNDVLRILTAFSVVVLPLTFIASLWGMNVGLPGGGSMDTFWVIVSVMAALLVGMLGYFRYRKWL